MKGWFTPTLSTLVLRQCLIVGSVSESWPGVDSPLLSADAFLSLSLCVRHSSSPVLGLTWCQSSCFPVELYTSRKLTGPLLCLCRTPPVRHHRGGTREVELARGRLRGRTEEERDGRSEAFSLFTALWYRHCSNRRSYNTAGWQCAVPISCSHHEYICIQRKPWWYNRNVSFCSLETDATYCGKS